MTDQKYLEEMIHLTTRLSDACNNFGLHSPEYNAVIEDIAVSAARFNHSRRRRHYLPAGVIFFLICFLAWLVYRILIWLEF